MNAPPELPDADASADSTAIIAPAMVVKNAAGASYAIDHIDVQMESPPDAHVEPPLKPTKQSAKQAQIYQKRLAQSEKTDKPVTSMQQAVENVKTRTAQIHQGAQHGIPPGANQLTIIPSPQDDNLSISTFNDSAGTISPPGSPKSKIKTPIMLLTNGDNTNGFSTVCNNKKRSIEFAVLLREQRPEPLDGISTKNYFTVLQSMEVGLEVVDLMIDPTLCLRRQFRGTSSVLTK
ncbi:hypothetical protein PsorP6_016588 [Peronosclerospora sorghi]|uniref:Uncharacterized protein n=1 Tax=Peronosclerospora sorghi TaxID=230839 RepID=A0ACC0VJ47_9STRA|nr:hypothetical protein PsorP6_016588 [Peronosclerospora sorghi]